MGNYSSNETEDSGVDEVVEHADNPPNPPRRDSSVISDSLRIGDIQSTLSQGGSIPIPIGVGLPHSSGGPVEINEPNTIFSIFVNKKLLEKAKMEHCFPEGYEERKLVEFELYAEENKDEIEGACGDSSEESKITISAQKVPNGYIIDTNVFLPDDNYNCIIDNYCILCDMQCNNNEHINLEAHSNKLKDIMPLEKFDMSMIRKINAIYHCGVCNKTIENDITLHFESKTHENQLLFAINKASDIMYDFDLHKKINDKYHFNVNNIVESGNYFTDSTKNKHSYSDYIENDHDYNPVNQINDYITNDNHDDDYINNNNNQSLSYASMARTPKVEKPVYIPVIINDIKIKVKYDCYHMVTSIGENRFYCMICKVKDCIRFKSDHCATVEHLNKMRDWTIVTKYGEFFIRTRIDENIYHHCGLCNNLQPKSDLEDHLEFRHPKELENHNAKIQNSYKINSTDKHNNNVNDNALCDNSAKNVDNSVKNDDNSAKYGDYSAKYGDYSAKYVDNSANTVDDVAKILDNSEKSVDNFAKHNIKMKLYNKPEEKWDVYRHISFNIFNKQILSLIHQFYVVLCNVDATWSCGLCNIPLGKTFIMDHVIEDGHLKLLQDSPFIQSLGFHLIRLLQVHKIFYCTLCNKIIDKKNLNDHLKEIGHNSIKKLRLAQTKSTGLPIALTLNTKDIPVTNIYDEYIQTIVDPAIIENAFNIEIIHNKVENDTNIQHEEIQDEKMQDEKIQDEEIQDEEIQDEEIQDDNEEDNSDTDLNETIDSIQEETFDVNEKIYLKHKNVYALVFTTSYHSLTSFDNRRLCFSCDEVVYSDDVAKHVDSRQHLDKLKKLNFVDKYGTHLIRQLLLMYHCAICNVVLPKTSMLKHIDNKVHNSLKTVAITKKAPSDAEIKEIKTQKEEIYLKHTEKRAKIIISAKIVPTKNLTQDKSAMKLNKLVIIQENTIILNWDSYHSITSLKDDYKCLLCQVSFVDSLTHVKSGEHAESLANNEFIAKFGVNLIRKIDSAKVNCAICNTQFNDNSSIIEDHIRGKKHLTTLEKIIKTSSEAEKYDDCDNEAIFI